jgi:hypothetical protein
MLVGSDWVQGAARGVYICSRDHKLEEEERSPCVAVWRDDRASHLPTARAEYMDAFFFFYYNSDSKAALRLSTFVDQMTCHFADR